MNIDLQVLLKSLQYAATEAYVAKNTAASESEENAYDAGVATGVQLAFHALASLEVHVVDKDCVNELVLPTGGSLKFSLRLFNTVNN
jgi:hypothetical protein